MQTELEDCCQNLDKDCQAGIDVFAKKSIPGVDRASAIGGIVTTTVLGSAAVGGTALSVGALAAAGTAWGSYLTAHVSNGVMSTGIFSKSVAVLFGTGKASETAKILGDATGALTLGITNAIVTIGTSFLVMFLLSAIAKIGLKAFISGRTPKLIKEMVEEVSRKLTEGLERVQDDLIETYQEKIEMVIEAKSKKLTEIRSILEKADPNERKQLEERIGSMKKLLEDGKAIPVNGVLMCK